jgi:hypothetical protein
MLLYVVTAGSDTDNPGKGGKVVGWSSEEDTAQFLAQFYPDTRVELREVSRAEVLDWCRRWGYENAAKGLSREHALRGPGELDAYYAGWDAYHAREPA